MSQPDPCVVIRIAIALAALKHRPRDQSFASYLLDLQSHFPAAIKDKDTRDWRTYALDLEKQLATLKAQRDADQELLSKLPTDASTSDAPPPKKKSKKNLTKDLEWSWDQSQADWSRVLSSQYPSSPSLVAAYAALKGALAVLNADLLSYASRLSDAILRALDTAHFFLFSPLHPSPDAQFQTAPQLKPEHIDSARIALASPLLVFVLRTGLHALVRTVQDHIKSKRPRQRVHATPISTDVHAYIDKVLDHLLECILLPLVRAITPLCSARLAPLVPAPTKKDKGKEGRAVGKSKGKGKGKDTNIASIDPPKKTDVRTDVFALLGTLLSALDALPPLAHTPGSGVGVDGSCGSIARGIRDRLGLETLRALEALYAVPAPQCPSQQPPSTPSDPWMPTPLSAPSPSQPHPPSPPPQTQRTTTESPATGLERLAETRADRVRALATRDAGWFLASTLNLCVTRGPGAGSTDGPGRRLREALLERIGKLVRSVPLGEAVSDGLDDPSASAACDDHGAAGTVDHNLTSSKLAVDPVCQNMLLAICERAMSHLAPS